jgi:pimeloyl-ACP methyl ester carboxylesterase
MDGAAGGSESISLETWADAVASVVKTAGARAVLVGHGMGAQVVELAAVRQPGIVDGLVLLCPAPLAGVHAPADAVSSFKALAGNFEAQREQRRRLSHDTAPADLDRWAQLGAAIAPDIVSKLVEAWNNGHPADETASGFLGRMLLIRGASDPFSDAVTIGKVAGRFVRADFATVERAGHWPHIERPDAVANLILEYLEVLRRLEQGSGDKMEIPAHVI